MTFSTRSSATAAVEVGRVDGIALFVPGPATSAGWLSRGMVGSGKQLAADDPCVGAREGRDDVAGAWQSLPRTFPPRA